MKSSVTLLVQVLCLLALVVLLFRTPEYHVVVPTDDPAPAIDEARLRRIIREEIHAFAASAGGPARPAGASVPAMPASAPPRDPLADADQRDFVEQQLAYLMSVGRMSDSELASLQHEISKLDPVTRREMLNRLARAINTGRIRQGVP